MSPPAGESVKGMYPYIFESLLHFSGDFFNVDLFQHLLPPCPLTLSLLELTYCEISCQFLVTTTLLFRRNFPKLLHGMSRSDLLIRDTNILSRDFHVERTEFPWAWPYVIEHAQELISDQNNCAIRFVIRSLFSFITFTPALYSFRIMDEKHHDIGK